MHLHTYTFTQTCPHRAPTGFRYSVPAICERVDDLLFGALTAAQHLMQPPAAPAAATKPQHARGGSGPAAAAATAAAAAAALSRGGGAAWSAPRAAGQPPPGAAAAAAAAVDPQRAAALRPFVQEQCLDMMQRLASGLEERLASLPPPAPGAPGAAAVEQALLIGRLCSALASGGAALPVALGPPAAWAGAAGGGGAARAAAAAAAVAAAAADAGAPLEVVTGRLRRLAAAAYAAWARWAADCIASELSASLDADAALSASSAPLCWVDTVVPVGGGSAGATDADALGFGLGLGGGGAAAGAAGLEEDMRFPLPAAPSAAALSALMAACWEAERAGGAAAAGDALQLLQWELQGALLEAVAARLGAGDGGGGGGGGAWGVNGEGPVARRQAGAEPVSEKGVLQLLFDLRVIRDVLAGAFPADGTAAPRGGGSGDAAPARSRSLGGSGVPEVASVGPVAAAALAERRRRLLGLEQQLQVRVAGCV
jgi:hypothetical protein